MWCHQPSMLQKQYLGTGVGHGVGWGGVCFEVFSGNEGEDHDHISDFLLKLS